ncbi:MAG: DUF4846 domain-containing protein [Bacteroidales bacterium]|nr:DUF4846 domain-containing protein [Bacteroidales bacterium]MCF8344214.1 DUF4846 domain-containing protein [Bacteroidales bacterium]MCF8349525.1 DUF4846 domain-containing protein [Bacteroidales bacterium]MCF8375084.1 DUF4846 domain-containing protein [Bacteroidales bacterium]MCF8399991.1 DUF4846 domain-containing protein [Bacteroidales bacterium]
MKTNIIFLISSLFLLMNCKGQQKHTLLINEEGTKIHTRIDPPAGYFRTNLPEASYGNYLRNCNLKPHGSMVKYYNGSVKTKSGVHIAVLDMEIGERDLQQCADAVMRLRGEYLFEQGQYEDIHFNYLSDGKPRFFTNYASGELSYRKFRKYIDLVFAFANTASLHNELKPVENIKNIQAGDVFIQKGTPYGHVVIVMDVAVNLENGEKVFLLAQSYMPAQDIHILINPENPGISPWYEAKEGDLITPEWDFTTSDLRRFP